MADDRRFVIFEQAPLKRTAIDLVPEGAFDVAAIGVGFRQGEMQFDLFVQRQRPWLVGQRPERGEMRIARSPSLEVTQIVIEAGPVRCEIDRARYGGNGLIVSPEVGQLLGQSGMRVGQVRRQGDRPPGPIQRFVVPIEQRQGSG